MRNLKWKWKITTQDDIFIFRSAFKTINYYKVYSHKQMKIEELDLTNNSCTLLKQYIPSEYCACGRSYSDTSCGDTLRFYDISWIPIKGPEGIRIALDLPIDCETCYYIKERNAGRFVPQHLYERLGINKDML